MPLGGISMGKLYTFEEHLLLTDLQIRLSKLSEFQSWLIDTNDFYEELPEYLQKELRHINNTVEGCMERYMKKVGQAYAAILDNGDAEVTTIRHKPTVLKAVKNAKGGQLLKTLNGPVFTNEGDWIITGVNGEQYPCDPEIFKELYEEVADHE